jgi:hypothetical protein
MHTTASRRRFLGTQLTLSAAAVGLLAGQPLRARAAPAAPMDAGRDAGILNVALALEHQAIHAYELGARSGLLQKPALEAALLFQGHHKAHRDALAGAIRQLGGMPVAERSLQEDAQALDAAMLKNQADVLRLAARLEMGAANAYLGVIPSFEDVKLAQVAARLAADETLHWTALQQALGAPLPAAALSFGG